MARLLRQRNTLLTVLCGNAMRLTMGTSHKLCTDAGPRLKPAVPPHLDAAQQTLYDNIVDTRIKVVGREALFDESGGLRGPWNHEVTSPALGQHLERLATAVRTENSLEARLYEVAILVVGVHWQAQFEWYAHEQMYEARDSNWRDCRQSAPGCTNRSSAPHCGQRAKGRHRRGRISSDEGGGARGGA